MSGRRRATERMYSAEDQALDQISKEAEERIQARRLARAEAREIRLREIERQQREDEEKQKGNDTPKASLSSYSGSRRGSDDSTESDLSSKDSRDPKDKVREIKNQLREMEEKYKQAMVTNAQLDNTKTSHVFQLELLKEQLEEKEETLLEVNREYKDKCRDYDLLKRDFESLTRENDNIKKFMEMKDKLLQDSGFLIVSSEEGELSLTKCADMAENPVPLEGSLIVSEEAAEILKKTAGGSLGKSDDVVELDKVKVRDTGKDICDKPEKRHVDDEVDVNENVYPCVKDVSKGVFDESEKRQVDNETNGKELNDPNMQPDVKPDQIVKDKVELNENVDTDLGVAEIEENYENINQGNIEKINTVETEQIQPEVEIETSNGYIDKERVDDGLSEDSLDKVKDNVDSPVFSLEVENGEHIDADDKPVLRPEIQDMFLKQGLIIDRDRSNIVSSASFISMESDVTYGELETLSYTGIDEEINALKQDNSDGSGVASKKDEFDEVFASITEGMPGIGTDCSDEALKSFARGYVKDIIQKSLDKVAVESFENSVVIRHQSLTAENIDIRIPKRHYSEDLVDNVTPFVSQNLPRGSIDILTPLTAVDSANADESAKYFSFKLDTEPDVVLQSVDEEKEDQVNSERVNSTMSSVSGYGVCVVGGVDGQGSPGTPLTQPSFSIGSPEFISMSISLESDNEDDVDKTQAKDQLNENKIPSQNEEQEIDEGKYETDLEKAIENVNTNNDSEDDSDDNADFEDAVEHVTEIENSEAVETMHANDLSIDHYKGDNGNDSKTEIIDIGNSNDNVENIDNASFESDDIVETVDDADKVTDIIEDEGKTIDVIQNDFQIEVQSENTIKELEMSGGPVSVNGKTEKTAAPDSLEQNTKEEIDINVNLENLDNINKDTNLEETSLNQNDEVNETLDNDSVENLSKANDVQDDAKDNETDGSIHVIEKSAEKEMSVSEEGVLENTETYGINEFEDSSSNKEENIETGEKKADVTQQESKGVNDNENSIKDAKNNVKLKEEETVDDIVRNEKHELSEEKSDSDDNLLEDKQDNDQSQNDDDKEKTTTQLKSDTDSESNVENAECVAEDVKNIDKLESEIEKSVGVNENAAKSDCVNSESDNISTIGSIQTKEESSIPDILDNESNNTGSNGIIQTKDEDSITDSASKDSDNTAIVDSIQTKYSANSETNNVAIEGSMKGKDDTGKTAFIQKFTISCDTDEDSDEENAADMGFTDKEISDVLDLLDVDMETTDNAIGAEPVKGTVHESDKEKQDESLSIPIDSGLKRPESIGIDSDPPSIDEASAASSETGEASGGFDSDKINTDKDTKDSKKGAEKDRKKKNENEEKKKKETPEKVERRHPQEDKRKDSRDEKKKGHDDKKRASKVEKKRDSHEEKKKEDKKKRESKAEKTKDDDKLRKIIEEKKKLQDEINTLTTELEEEKAKKNNAANKVPTMNGPEMQLYEIQKEASKQIHEYKLKLQKGEQEIANLEGTVNRLETQVKRFKYDAEEAEKLEDELKTDRRRLQKELRECQNQIEELQNQNKYLNKRLEKIRQTRSALVNP